MGACDRIFGQDEVGVEVVPLLLRSRRQSLGQEARDGDGEVLHLGRVRRLGVGRRAAGGDDPCRPAPHNASFQEFMREVVETIDLVFVKQNAFTPKRTFLKQLPVARAIACAILENETLMGPRTLKRGVQRGLAVLALTPAYVFILHGQAGVSERTE